VESTSGEHEEGVVECRHSEEEDESEGEDKAAIEMIFGVRICHFSHQNDRPNDRKDECHTMRHGVQDLFEDIVPLSGESETSCPTETLQSLHRLIAQSIPGEVNVSDGQGAVGDQRARQCSDTIEAYRTSLS
jgi:hypothetical protein